MSVYRFTLAVFSAFVLVTSARADNQVWFATAVTGTIDEDTGLLVWFDGHLRQRDGGEQRDVTILRPGVGYRVNSKLDVWLGYARVVASRDGGNIEENRIWQQATYPIVEVLGGKISGRTRLEQRFRNTGNDTGWRIRQFVRWSRPIIPGDLDFVLANETFIGLSETDWGQRTGFDQNRGFAGLAYHISPQLRLEGGYLNNLLDQPVGTDVTNHNASFALFWSF